MWKSTVIEASDKIFPGLVYHDREKEFWDMGHLVRSSLPLQIALYTNVWIFCIWFLISLASLDSKYFHLSSLYKFITIAVLIVYSVFECARLYFGYLGNLADKIPELASFWLISTLLQLPLILFMLLDGKTMPFLIERIAHGCMLVLLIIEIVTGTIALKKTADHHAKRFYTAQSYGIDCRILNQ
ncbi:transmembrane protein 17B-like [Venturia canescens]|uniref:transmembrane protein 17B-like n=1 Tax=Venturia canescens TaxID=32260 RepID=UPI001C9CB86E|nr:transmembrane protein 17B-like [Venturia canescens]XP_043267449.1 transmembrane protein 17B-like [Venturia canescens]